jgi:hypothetical protein
MSAYATLSGVPVLDARVSFPRVGAWTAELRVDTQERPAGAQLLSLGSAQFVGAVARAAVHKANAWVRLTGGAGALGTTLAPKGYHSAPVIVPLQDIAADCGEVLAGSSDGSITRAVLGHWARLEGAAGNALNQLLETLPGAVWRFLPNGQLWVGVETWPSISPDVELIDYQPLRDCVQLFAISPGILPGATFLGRRVSYVEHRVSEARIGTFVWFEASQ